MHTQRSTACVGTSTRQKASILTRSLSLREAERGNLDAPLQRKHTEKQRQHKLTKVDSTTFRRLEVDLGALNHAQRDKTTSLHHYTTVWPI